MSVVFFFKHIKSIDMTKQKKIGGYFEDDSPSPTNTGNTSNNTGSSMKDNIMSKKDKAKEFVKSYAIIIIVIVALLVIVVITIWIISLVRKSNMKVVNISDRIIRLDKAENMPLSFAASKFPKSNGQEFTFSFWLYLSDYDVLYNHRVLFRRGGSVDSINFGNPIVALDSKTNKMYIAIKTNQSTDVTSVEDVLTKGKNFSVSIIDYVPLQRWVHIGFSIQDSVTTVFMDGDIYSVRSITDNPDIDPVPTSNSVSANNSPRAFYSNTLGDMYVGDSQFVTKGFLSRIQYFNYSCTQKDMQQIYKAGPVKQSILSMIGLNAYGVRTPLYKIDASD